MMTLDSRPTKRGRGRPAKTEGKRDVQISVKLPSEMVAALDDYARRTKKTRAAVVHDLLTTFLTMKGGD